jgi:hypothetical protein
VVTVWACVAVTNGFQFFPLVVVIAGLSGGAAATLRERPPESAAA